MKLLSAWTKRADHDQTALVGAFSFGYTLLKVYFFSKWRRFIVKSNLS